MTSEEWRNRLILAAQELRTELHKIVESTQGLEAALISEADKLLPVVADEHQSPRVVGRIKYRSAKVGAAAPIPQAAEAPPKLAAGKRACSICRKPGHRKFNCPEANKDFKEKRDQN